MIPEMQEQIAKLTEELKTLSRAHAELQNEVAELRMQLGITRPPQDAKLARGY